VPHVPPERRLDGPCRYISSPFPPALFHVLTHEAAANNHLIRETSMFVRFEVRMTVSAWDDEWVHISYSRGRVFSDYP
jgi:hypothetical protein